MWDESLTMIPKIWESDTFEWEGKFWNVPPRQVLPKPYQKPHPPIWVAALQPATYELAAQKGIGVMALGVNAPSVLEPHIKAYREAVKDADPVGNFVNNRWLRFLLRAVRRGQRPHPGVVRPVPQDLLRAGPSLRPGPEGRLRPPGGAVGRRT